MSAKCAKVEAATALEVLEVEDMEVDEGAMFCVHQSRAIIWPVRLKDDPTQIQCRLEVWFLLHSPKQRNDMPAKILPKLMAAS